MNLKPLKLWADSIILPETVAEDSLPFKPTSVLKDAYREQAKALQKQKDDPQHGY